MHSDIAPYPPKPRGMIKHRSAESAIVIEVVGFSTALVAINQTSFPFREVSRSRHNNKVLNACSRKAVCSVRAVDPTTLIED